MQNNSRSLNPPAPSPRHDGAADPTRTSSFRVYYGGSSGSIPFKWESAPGTPIHSLSSVTSSPAIPPLAPPPSFHFADVSAAPSWPKSKLRPGLLTCVFQKLKRSVRHVSPLHSSESFTSSLSSSSLAPGEAKSGYVRVGRLFSEGYSRPTSPLQSGGEREYFDRDCRVVRTASFDGTQRFDKMKRRFGGCFGI